jgi:hypothetical protein|eukprot:COSAG02_NODE_6507_length_3531_cov_1.989219_3_plen_72_part_00
MAKKLMMVGQRLKFVVPLPFGFMTALAKDISGNRLKLRQSIRDPGQQIKLVFWVWDVDGNGFVTESEVMQE